MSKEITKLLSSYLAAIAMAKIGKKLSDEIPFVIAWVILCGLL